METYQNKREKLSKKNRKTTVYSTDSDFQYEYEQEHILKTLVPENQNLKILIDRKARKGKEATLIKGFQGTSEDLKSLGQKLKKICAVGGSVKNNEIIIQGNVREKIYNILIENGYNVKKVGG